MIRHECFDWHFVLISRYFSNKNVCDARFARVSNPLPRQSCLTAFRVSQSDRTLLSAATHIRGNSIRYWFRPRVRSGLHPHPPPPNRHTFICWFPFCFSQYGTRSCATFVSCPYRRTTIVLFRRDRFPCHGRSLTIGQESVVFGRLTRFFRLGTRFPTDRVKCPTETGKQVHLIVNVRNHCAGAFKGATRGPRPSPFAVF